jgi:hypothetical protein
MIPTIRSKARPKLARASGLGFIKVASSVAGIGRSAMLGP